MDIGKLYRTDRQKETEGVWVLIGGSEFLITRSNNRAYRKNLAEKLEANAAALDADTEESEALDNRLMAEVLAETILLDWKNVKVDGKATKYSVKAATLVMTEMPDFAELIRNQAGNIDNFRVKHEKTQEKN